MKVNIILIAFLSSVSLTQAQTIFGKWNTIDDETGKIESVVEIYENNGKAHAKIIDILNKEDRDRLCDKCTGVHKNAPILGMVLVSDLEQDGDEWSGGKILDPKSGKYYKCYLKLEDNNKLKLRGYIGISIIGRTEYWYRVKS
ncbi:DUF2147 domain-containing protein [Arenibacter sp. GZD96]|uniref:DUF2147 domain-containing protein n=1 Tax=Aurantibrevibacter litoralis TaxID=3106030 RepID=UPI002AFFF566|nr:DUF2147 domain-containing protein [Arenibacter sp. GZD-96]MEA1785414.1 DUF2147 domain-containing protein [Arenibacter sp. GZD-96]